MEGWYHQIITHMADGVGSTPKAARQSALARYNELYGDTLDSSVGGSWPPELDEDDVWPHFEAAQGLAADMHHAGKKRRLEESCPESVSVFKLRKVYHMFLVQNYCFLLQENSTTAT
jgi:hypothetical protein